MTMSLTTPSVILFLLLQCSMVFGQTPEEQTVAEVNGETVSISTLDEAIRETFEQSFVSKERIHQLRKQVLAKIIDDKLLTQAAQTQDFTGDINEFLKERVYSEVSVDSDELRAYYNEHFPKRPREWRLRHIVIEKGMEPEATKRTLDNALAATTPENFSQAAKRYSNAATALKGGDLGFVTLNQLDPALRNTVQALQVGEISEPIETEKSFQILFAEDFREERKPAFEEVQALVRQRLLAQKQQGVLQRFLQQLREQAKIIVYIN